MRETKDSISSERNIAKLLRNRKPKQYKKMFSGDMFRDLFRRFDLIGYVDVEVIDEIPLLGYKEEREIPSRKGVWQTYQRYDYSIPSFLEEKREEPSSGFVAVYHRDDKPRTMFLGQQLDEEGVEKNIETLSKNVLDQRSWISFPPSKFFEGSTGYRLSKKITIPIGALWLTTLDTFIKDIWDLDYYSLSSAFADMLRTVDKYIQPDIWIMHEFPGIGSFQMGALYYILATSSGIIAKTAADSSLGKKADKFRTKNLPEEARHFLYGAEAEDNIREEYDVAFYETIKAMLYDSHKKATQHRDATRFPLTTKQKFDKTFEELFPRGEYEFGDNLLKEQITINLLLE